MYALRGGGDVEKSTLCSLVIMIMDGSLQIIAIGNLPQVTDGKFLECTHNGKMAVSIISGWDF